jgi:hypothetical protein
MLRAFCFSLLTLFVCFLQWPAFAVDSAFPPSELTLTQAQIQNGKFRFVLNGRSGGKYVTERSTNLVSWRAISTNTLPISGSTNIEVQLSTNKGGVFYRTREDTSSLLFMDGFDRADSPEVGGNWTETDSSNVLSIRNGALRMTSNADRFAYVRVPGGNNVLGVKITMTLRIDVKNGHEVIQIGTEGGGTGDIEYRDCFGFAILPAYGVQPNDTELQDKITPFNFVEGTIYDVELLIFADSSREMRVWPMGGVRPVFPTAYTQAQTRTAANGSRYQIGFDAGGPEITDVSIGEFRVEPITGSTGTSIILVDAFEREDSSNVGGIWDETDASNVVAIKSGALRLSSNADRFGYIRTPAGTNQFGVMISFTLNVSVLNSGQVLQVGTKAGGGADNEYRDCFGFAILPATGVVPNDTTFQGDVTPFTFVKGTVYQVEMLVFSDNSRELRVWPVGGTPPAYPTAFAIAQTRVLASGFNYQIGFDSGSDLPTELFVDDVRIQRIIGVSGTANLLFDPFDRTDSKNVGGAWEETDRDDLLSIQSGGLRMSSTQDKSAYLRQGGATQLGVKTTFSLSVVSKNGTEVIQVGTRAGGAGDNPYRDCFGFAIFPAFGVQANDTTFQGSVTPFTFADGGTYQVEILIAQDNSRQLRVWSEGGARPSTATLAVAAQTIIRATGGNYQIGFDSGSAKPSDIRIDDFRIEKTSK